MKKEDKELLLKDLCARLPYKVKCKGITYADYNDIEDDYETEEVTGVLSEILYYKFECIYVVMGLMNECELGTVKPYLRPMSSMTEEERKEFSKLLVKRYCEEDWEGHISTSYCIEIDNVYTDDEDGIKYPSAFSMEAIDWLNAHHFDYRDLIPKGLAIEALEGMYGKEEHK